MTSRLDRYYERQMQDPQMRDLVEKEIASLGVGIQIARLREKENLNQTQLAARAGMNASKISLIETSTKNVTLGTLARLAHALNRRIKIEFVVVKEKKNATAIAHKRAAGSRSKRTRPTGESQPKKEMAVVKSH